MLIFSSSRKGKRHRLLNVLHHSTVNHIPVNVTDTKYPPPGDRLMPLAPMISAKDMYRKKSLQPDLPAGEIVKCTSVVQETKVVPQERGDAIITGRLWGNCYRKTVEEYRLYTLKDGCVIMIIM